MRPMADAWAILIEITNACRLRCAHCTAGVPHVRRPYFMSLDHLERALQSLQGWKKAVGCFGGEPTLHPHFEEVCALFRRYFPREQLALWTCGGPRYEQHKQLISDTFAIVTYNDHHAEGHHQPLMIANEEVVADPEERERLIDNCWVPRHWSPLITHRGAYFCEVAATFDNLFNGPGGLPLEPGWWRRDLADVRYQRDFSCRFCSLPLAVEPLPDSIGSDWVSPGNAARLREAQSPLALEGKLTLVDSLDGSQPLRRNPRWFAKTGTDHYWSRITLRAGFWLAAQYRHVPSHAVSVFARDVERFARLKLHLGARAVVQLARRAWGAPSAAD